MYANPGDMDGTIDLWWAKSDGNDIAGYKVYSGTTPGVYGKPLEAGNTNHYQFTGLINNKEYYISVSAYDMDGNESLPSKEIIAIPRDEDTEPPVFSSFYPSEVVEETDFYIKCTINDHSDIYDDNTGADGQGVYLAWDIDEISEKSYVMRMSQISPNTFVTDSRIPGQPLGTTIKYRVYAYDNDFDLGNIEDRTKGVSEEHTVGLIQSPSIAYNYPNPAPSGQYTDRTIFRYYTSSNAKITISIYSPAGFLVDRLDGQSQGEGYDEIEWNISSIASGVYIYTIEIQPISGNKQVIKKKLAIVK